MWTSENRPKYNRDKLRYPSDLTDDEWSHIEPLIPPAKRGGRKRAVDPREIVNGVMYRWYAQSNYSSFSRTVFESAYRGCPPRISRAAWGEARPPFQAILKGVQIRFS